MVGRILLLSVIIFIFIIPDEAEGWRRRRRRRCHRANCAVSSWSRWGSCSAYQCGLGTQTRTRRKTRTESCGGSCPYQLRQTRRCSSGCRNGGIPSYGRCVCRSGFSGRCCGHCNRVNCAVSSWSRWGSCSAYQCGLGTQTRTRRKTRAEACGGSCPYQLRQTRRCSSGCRNGGIPSYGRCLCRSGFSGKCCERCNRVNCAMSSWSRWGSCSAKSCGLGTQTRTRRKTRAEACGGSCPYQTRQTRRCNSGCRNGGTPSYGRCLCRSGFSGRCCGSCNRVNCAMSSWSRWGSCSAKSCGLGTQTRTRRKTRAEACGGSCPYQTRQTRRCNSGCRNGGTPTYGRCICRPIYTGRCCEALASCKEGSVSYNKCGERCKCRRGKIKECTRIRKEFTTMTTAERTKYINTIKVASTDCRYKKEYNKLLTVHRTLFSQEIHTKDNFLPWHRWFNLQYENLLRKVDCTVTLAYWDWSRVSSTAWRGLQRDLWYTGNSGFGGNGSCVQTGPFREAVWKLVPCADSDCLSREFFELPPDSIAVQNVLNMPPAQFDVFEMALRDNLHDTVHCVIGGTMCSIDAASAPEFFLHHGFIDKLWADWQAKSSTHRNVHFSSLSRAMPGTSLRPRDLINLNAQPGGVRVKYRPVPRVSLPSVSRPHGGRFKVSFKLAAKPGSSRPQFSTVNERAMKLFGLKPEEIKKVKEIAKKLDPPKSVNAIA